MDKKNRCHGLFMSIVTILLLVMATTACEREPDPEDWTFGPFEKPVDVNPVLTPSTEYAFHCPMRDTLVYWEEMATFNPAAVVKDNKIHVLYRAEDQLGEMVIGGHTSRLGMMTSEDGLNFTRLEEPVFYPDNDDQKEYEWPGGVEDPRIVETEDGLYVMTYTQWNHDTPRLAVATSGDLMTWDKHGPAFKEAYDGKYLDMHTKAGSIVTRLEGSRMVAEQINGKYWMYWGVPEVHLATSDDLQNWTPIETDDGELKSVMTPREGYYDSWLVEPGPPALITEHGILVIYNAGNDIETGDPDIPDRMYSAGQALYDVNQPERLIARTEEPFVQPDLPFETTGQYEDGTTFLEGLVYHNGRWFIYYGAADSRVGVLYWDP